MKKRILIWISCAILSLGLCSCGTDTGGADTLTSEPSNEVSTEIQETKLSIWDRSESDIMSSIKERFADQDVFDGTFSIVESTDETVGTLYAIFKDGTYTYTGFSFMEEKDSGREKLTLMSIDYNSDGALEAFFLGAGATLMEGDTEGRYQSLSQAVDAFRTEFKDLSSSNTSVEIGDIEYVFGISGSFVMLGMNQVTSDAATSSTSGNSTSRSDNSTDSKGDSDDSTASSQQPTLSQSNALKSAKSYLEFAAFSYNSLVEQLEYEEYSHEDAVYAVEHCGADWNEQAAKSAKQYLDITSFSKNGLISQLEYEGFTHEQAVYGVEAAGY